MMQIHNNGTNGQSEQDPNRGAKEPIMATEEISNDPHKMMPIYNDSDIRIARPNPTVLRKRTQLEARPTIKEQISSMEEELGKLAAKGPDHVYLMSNKGGAREDIMHRTVMDIIASASLGDFSPDGVKYRGEGKTYADLSHIPATFWLPSLPIRFSDTHGALMAAREVANEEFETMFDGFSPDEIPLANRRVAATFITGNPRSGQVFISDLEKSIPISNIVVAHWLPPAACSETWTVFCIPATQHEIEVVGLKLDQRVYSTKRTK